LKTRLLIGTGGFSVWRSDDDGESFQRLLSDTGLYSESRAYALAKRPDSPVELLTGTDSGIYRLHADKLRFEHHPSEMDQTAVWSIAYSPHDPSLVLAGTRPARIHRSTDGGKTWHMAAGDLPQKCPYVLVPRVTKIQFSTKDPNVAWASVEVGGVWRSTDAGASWHHASEGMVSDDVHDITCLSDGSLFATTNEGLHRAQGNGGSWSKMDVDVPTPYFRTIRERADGKVLLLGGGDGPPGSMGTLLRSRDSGASWQPVQLPIRLESTLYSFATNPLDPNLIFATTALGQILRSRDGGESWEASPRRLGEVRSLAWVALD
jgi:photosystem II stability/assembly factor-like uncharacterized protein